MSNLLTVRSTPRLAGASALLIVCVAPCVFGQTVTIPGSTRPYRAVFGGSTTDPSVRHSFDVTASIEAANEKNDYTQSADSPSPLLRGGVYTGASAGLLYSWNTKNLQIAANAAVNERYYTESDEFTNAGNWVGIGFSTQVGERLRLSANHSLLYSPSYFYGLTPPTPLAVGAVTGADQMPIGDESVWVNDTAASFSYGLTRRGWIEAVASHRLSDFSADSGTGTNSDLRSYSVGGRYRQTLSRNTTLRLGYLYRQGTYGSYATTDSTQSTAVHEIDTGVDYARSLSFTRRTSLDFSVGSALVNPPISEGQQQLVYRVVGDVGLTHEMGRTWRARIGYGRSVGFVEAFPEPVFADNVNVSLNGFFNRRTDLSVNGNMSNGDVGLSASRSRFRTWYGSTRIRMALNGTWALYGEYLYSYQDMGTAILVPSGIPSRLDRQSIRGGLTVWIPLLRR